MAHEAKGTLILEESGYGLYVLCPEVHPEQPVALLDLFYPSPEGKEEAHRSPLALFSGRCCDYAG